MINFTQFIYIIMAAKKINGLLYAKQFAKNLGQRILRQKKLYNFPQETFPRLALILVGDNPASLSYIKRKKKYATKALIKSRLFKIQNIENLSQLEIVYKVIKKINKLNDDEKYNGIILQLPIHKKVNQWEDYFLDLINSDKDVDCLGKVKKAIFQKQGKLAKIKPCVVEAILKIFQENSIDFKNKNIMIIGKGKLVGTPLYSCLSKQTSNIYIVDHTTPQPLTLDLVGQCDIILTATGHPNNIKQHQLKKGCVIIDIGVCPDPQKPGQVRGDFDEQVKKNVSSFYTPVPKGVGPVVVTSLLHNTYKVWLEQMKKKFNKQ